MLREGPGHCKLTALTNLPGMVYSPRTMRIFHPITILIVVVLLAGCSLRQEISLRVDGSGEVTVTVQLHETAARYLLDLAEAMGDSLPADQRRVFQVETIESELRDQGGLEVISVVSPSPETLVVELLLSDIETLFAEAGTGGEAGVEPVIVFRRAAGNGDTAGMDFSLNRRNFPLLTRRLAIENSPMGMLLPTDEEGFFSEEDYLDLFDYAFGDYVGDSSIEKILRDSIIRVEIEVESSVVSQSGGSLQGKVVTYDIPLLRLLTLEEPIRFGLEFR